MQKKFLANLILLLSLNLLIKPFYIFGIDLTIQNQVGTDYGLYFVVFNFSFLFNILLDCGITNFNNRNIAQNSQLLHKHFSSMLTVKLLLLLSYFFITFGAALIIGYEGIKLRYLFFLGINQFLISFILYLRSNVSGLLLFRTDSFLSILDRVLLIIICGVLLWSRVAPSPFRIEWFIYAQTASYGLTALVALVIVIRKAAFRKLTWNWPFIVLIFRKSFPFALLVLLMTFYNRIDPVMIERLLSSSQGKEQATIYASSFRILDAVNMIGYLFAVLLLPIFANMLKNREPVAQMVKLSFTLLMVVALIISLGCHFYSDQVMELLMADHAEQSADVFRIMMFGFIAISMSYIFGTLLTANGNLMHLNLIAGGSMLLSLILNLILIPRYLAVGSAYASVITQFVSAIAQVILVQLVFRFKWSLRFLLTLALFILGLVVINLATRSLIQPWGYAFGVMVTASLGYAFALRLIRFSSLIGILTGKTTQA
ncbi:MAG TPA: oligosaccharide flippase family protein [Bacteroidales bacterium]|nr:oligosaccharide flippase family protein [Bacteroidales bacterium]HNS47459.1 oligosaccharide flippase family protein [Bacteroidales bacterium]